jgi:hypothetical protein
MLSKNPIKQEIFDFGLVEILKQGKPSINAETKSCMYKHEDGSNCIIGKMLPKDFIIDHPHINTSSVISLIHVVTLPEELKWMAKEPMPGFLLRLQGCHDDAAIEHMEDWRVYEGSEFIERFKERMQKFAAKHILIYKEPVL